METQTHVTYSIRKRVCVCVYMRKRNILKSKQKFFTTQTMLMFGNIFLQFCSLQWKCPHLSSFLNQVYVSVSYMTHKDNVLVELDAITPPVLGLGYQGCTSGALLCCKTKSWDSWKQSWTQLRPTDGCWASALLPPRCLHPPGPHTPTHGREAGLEPICTQVLKSEGLPLKWNVQGESSKIPLLTWMKPLAPSSWWSLLMAHRAAIIPLWTLTSPVFDGDAPGFHLV